MALNRNTYIDTLKFISVFIVFFTHFINRYGEQYRWIFTSFPSSILLQGVSGKMGVAILAVLSGWLAYKSNRRLPDVIIHRYCFFLVSVFIVNSLFLIQYYYQKNDCSFITYLYSCVSLGDQLYPALWFIRDFFLGYIIICLNRSGEIKMYGVFMEILICLIFHEVWISICLLGNVVALLEDDKYINGLFEKKHIQYIALFLAYIMSKKSSEDSLTYLLYGISCVLFLFVLRKHTSLRTLFSNRLTAFLGRNSWGFFLVHVLVYNVMGRAFDLEKYRGMNLYGIRMWICFICCSIWNVLLSIPLTFAIKKLSFGTEQIIKKMTGHFGKKI